MSETQPPPPKKWAEGKVWRVWNGREPMDIVREAIAEVEQLKAENRRLERALETIANYCRKSQDHKWTVRTIRAMANLSLLGEDVDD